MDEKVDKLIEAIDNSDTIKSIKDDLKTIKDNKDLINKLEKYQETPSEELKRELIEYPELSKYYRDENELNYLILEINKRLKEITNESN